MVLRTLIFLTVMILVLAGAGTYMSERTLALCPLLAAHPGAVRLATLALLAGMLLMPILHRVPALGRAVTPLLWLSYGCFGLVSTFLVYLLAADLVQALVRLATGLRIGPWAYGLALGGALVSVLLGLVAALRPAAVRTVEVPITGLPAALDGFRIVQISDLHLGPLVPWYQVDHVLAASNALAPDLVAVTGDLVDAEADGVRPKAQRLGALRARHGVFFVTGNHEYYSGADRWLQVIRSMGWRVLDNEHALLEHGGARLAVAGMPDPTAASLGRGPDLAQALAGVPADAVPILLFHPPTGTKAAGRAGVRLQLSGHTHGGQYFPWSLLVPALFRHGKGLSREGSLWVYTSVGTGFWGPPDRFLVPSELTLLELRTAAPD
jgi:hypothetical protein